MEDDSLPSVRQPLPKESDVPSDNNYFQNRSQIIAEQKQGVFGSYLMPRQRETQEINIFLNPNQINSNNRERRASEMLAFRRQKNIKVTQVLAPKKNTSSSIISSYNLDSVGSRRKASNLRRMRRKDSLTIKKYGSVFSRSKSKNKISMNSKAKQKQEDNEDKFVEVVWTAHEQNKKHKTSANFKYYGKSFRFDPCSLGCFSEKSRIRRFIVQVVENKWFDRFILSIIFANAITMLSYDNKDKMNQTQNNKLCDKFQDIFTYIFAAEVLLKIIEQGFFRHKNAYLRDGWNWIDFIVAILGLLESLLDNVFPDLPSLGPVRMLRAFRPLKSINSIPSMRKLIVTLITALPALANVVIFLIFVFILFGILGLHQFSGALYYRCRITQIPADNRTWPIDPNQISICSKEADGGQYQCRNGTFCGAPQEFGLDPWKIDDVLFDEMISNGFASFDNLGFAVFTIFQIITLEGWTNVMYNLQDNSNPYLVFAYFFLVVLFGSFFILNYFLAVFMESFDQAANQINDSKKEIIETSDSEPDSPSAGQKVKNQKKQISPPRIQEVQNLDSIVAGTQRELLPEIEVKKEVEKFEKKGVTGTIILLNQNLDEFSSFESHHFTSCEEEESKEEHSKMEGSSKADESVIPESKQSKSNMSQGKSIIDDRNQVSFIKQVKKLHEFSNNLKEVGSFKLENGQGIKSNTQERKLSLLMPKIDLFGGQELPKPEEIPAEEGHQPKQKWINLIQNFCKTISLSDSFNFGVFACILANTILLSLDKYPISKSQSSQMETSNQIFSALFFIEMVIKLFGLGFKQYFNDKFNQFDCSIVIVSTIDTTLSYSFPDVNSGGIGKSVTIFRGFRLLRIFKLARSWKSFQIMLFNIKETLKDIANFSILLGIVVFIYTLIGMELFSYTYKNSEHREKPRLNFDYLSNALVSVSVVLIGEDWNKLMIDTMVDQTYPIAAALYFVSLVIIGSMILMNLFLAILLKNFAMRKEEDKEEFKESKSLSFYMGLVKNKIKYWLFLCFGSSRRKGPIIREELSLKLTASMPQIDRPKSSIPNRRDTIPASMIIKKGMTLKEKEIKEEGNDGLKANFATQLEIKRLQRQPSRAGKRGKNKLLAAIDVMREKKNQGIDLLELVHSEVNSQAPQTKRNSEPPTPNVRQETNDAKTPKIVEIANERPKFLDIIVEKRTSEKTGQEESPEKIVEIGISKFQLLAQAKMSSDLVQPKIGEIKTGSILMKSIMSKTQLLVSQHQAAAAVSISDKLEGTSLFFLSTKNRFRGLIATFVFHKQFDNVILMIILASSVSMIAESPLNDPKNQETKIFEYIDIVITTIFSIESIFKIITFGFVVNGKSSYLRNGWNILDSLTVLISLVSLGFTNLDLKAIKVLRVLRILRPLKMIARNESLKIQITSLLLSIPGIINVAILSGIFMLLFGIFFTNFFKGTFYSCQGYFEEETNGNSLETKWDCFNQGGAWVNNPNNFDNALDSFVTLFIMTTTEGWIKFMHLGSDAKGIDYEPVLKIQDWTRIFFVLYTLFGFLFMLNLFMEVVVSAFQKEKEKLHKNQRLTESMRDWLNFQIMCLTVSPKQEIQTESRVRKLAIDFVNSDYFDRFIITSIFANTVLLAIHWVNIEESILKTVERLNLIFSSIFLAEAVLKIFALRKHYFKEGWNIFDFIIVLGSWMAFLLSNLFDFKFNSQTTIMRSFRIGRILRLMRKAKSLQVIFSTLVLTFPSLANVGALLLLFIYIFSVLGMNLFAQVKLQTDLNRHANFQTFARSFMTLVRVSTGESWFEIMNNCGEQKSILFKCINNPSYEQYKDNGSNPIGCGNSIYAQFYFISFIMVIALIFLNLFIAVILQGFNETSEQINMFLSSTEIERYQDCWMQIEPLGLRTTKVEKIKHLFKILAKKSSPLVDNINTKSDQDMEDVLQYLELPLYNKNTECGFTDILLALAENEYRETYMVQNKEMIFKDFKENYNFEPDEFGQIGDYDRMIAMIEALKSREKIQLCKRYDDLKEKKIKTKDADKDELFGFQFDSYYYIKAIQIQRAVRDFLQKARQKNNLDQEQQEREEELYQTEQSKEVKEEEVKEEVPKNLVSTIANERTFDQMLNPRNPVVQENMSRIDQEEESSEAEVIRVPRRGHGNPEFDNSQGILRSNRESLEVKEFQETEDELPPINLQPNIKHNMQIMNKNAPFAPSVFTYQAEQLRRNAKIGKDGVYLLHQIIEEDPNSSQLTANKLSESQFFSKFVRKERPKPQLTNKMTLNSIREDQSRVNNSSILPSMFYGQNEETAKKVIRGEEDMFSKVTNERNPKASLDIPEDISVIQDGRRSQTNFGQVLRKVLPVVKPAFGDMETERKTVKFGHLSINKKLQKESIKIDDHFSKAQSSFAGVISFESSKKHKSRKNTKVAPSPQSEF